MFGPALMANPVIRAGAGRRAVYLPAGTTWTDFWTGETHPGGRTIETAAPIDTLPLFVRAGSIIPYGPAIEYAAQAADPIELRLYRGADGAFTLYEDEGDNYDYEHGVYATIALKWNEAKQTLEIGRRRGSFAGMLKQRIFRIVWVSPGHGVGISPATTPDTVVAYDGRAVRVHIGR
jgi:alpha-D-xyloside xylohydrolase